SSEWQLHPLECAHGWSPCGIVQRTARTPARRQNGPRSGTHLGTSAATARSAKTEIAESEYCSRFPQLYDLPITSNTANSGGAPQRPCPPLVPMPLVT